MKKLKDEIKVSPLLDSVEFTKNLESIYTNLVQKKAS